MKTENTSMCLTMGVFLSLLCDVKKVTKAKKNGCGFKSHSDIAILTALSQMIADSNIAPQKGGALEKRVSEFKNCRTDKLTAFPQLFTKADIDSFDKKVRKNYEDVLNMMTVFIDEYLNIDSITEKSLVRCMLYVIKCDTSIRSNNKLFVLQNGDGLTKSALLKEHSVCLDSFILGVWHYLVVKQTDNIKGKVTIDSLFDTHKNTTKQFNSSAINNRNSKMVLVNRRGEDADVVPNDAEPPKKHVSTNKEASSKKKAEICTHDRELLETFRTYADWLDTCVFSFDYTVTQIDAWQLENIEDFINKWARPDNLFYSKNLNEIMKGLLKGLETYLYQFDLSYKIFDIRHDDTFCDDHLRLKVEKLDAEDIKKLREKDLRIRQGIYDNFSKLNRALETE